MRLFSFPFLPNNVPPGTGRPFQLKDGKGYLPLLGIVQGSKNIYHFLKPPFGDIRVGPAIEFQWGELLESLKSPIVTLT